MKPVTVKEAIELLQQYQEDLPLVLIDRKKNTEDGVESMEKGFIRTMHFGGARHKHLGLCVGIEFITEEETKEGSTEPS